MTLSHPTQTGSRSATYDRPAARFTDDEQLEVRASALGQCRRALWYAATEQDVTNPMSDETKTVLEAGQALEAVVVRAMQRRFWTVTPADPDAPLQVEVEAGPGLTVTGHPDATGAIELFGDESVIEVKTRGPEAFKRWQTLGAERSHPDSVAQAACYSLGLYGECRDVVIATLDTGARSWDYEVIPAERVERAWDRACERLAPLAEHYELHGPNPEALPERDFTASDWQCQRCPYLNVCQPGEAAEAVDEADAEPTEPVSDEVAHDALLKYEQIQQQLKSLDADKRGALKTLQHWLQQKGEAKARLEGSAKTRTVGMVTSRRYAVDHKRLNALLEPEQRAEIVTEQTSEYLRVS
ncbi:MAG: PD-(D/E)XK nuclease family protein [Chloroflexi bacterium]|nr:PD-(D/E)XK nuclease family protein [Chloroflexota bacterium]